MYGAQVRPREETNKQNEINNDTQNLQYLCARWYSQYLCHLLYPPCRIGRAYFYYTHFTNEETDAQRCSMTFLKLHTW